MTSSLLTNRCAPLINRTRSCSLYTATIIPWLQPLHGVISSQDAPISSALYLSILSCFYARTRDLPHVLAGMLFECKRVDVEIGLFAFVFIAIDKIHHFFSLRSPCPIPVFDVHSAMASSMVSKHPHMHPRKVRRMNSHNILRERNPPRHGYRTNHIHFRNICMKYSVHHSISGLFQRRVRYRHPMRFLSQMKEGNNHSLRLLHIQPNRYVL